MLERLFLIPVGVANLSVNLPHNYNCGVPNSLLAKFRHQRATTFDNKEVEETDLFANCTVASVYASMSLSLY